MLAAQNPEPFANDDALDLVWGAAAIGKLIGRTPRETFYLLETNQLPATKVGRQWCASRRGLRARFAPVLGEAA